MHNPTHLNDSICYPNFGFFDAVIVLLFVTSMLRVGNYLENSYLGLNRFFKHSG